LEHAFGKAKALPPEEQDMIASQILDTLADEDAWRKRFAEKIDVLRRLEQEAMAEADPGLARPLDELLDRVQALHDGDAVGSRRSRRPYR
jgi:hypothetical protein